MWVAAAPFLAKAVLMESQTSFRWLILSQEYLNDSNSEQNEVEYRASKAGKNSCRDDRSAAPRLMQLKVPCSLKTRTSILT
jgi:hypothetical protein